MKIIQKIIQRFYSRDGEGTKSLFSNVTHALEMEVGAPQVDFRGRKECQILLRSLSVIIY